MGELPAPDVWRFAGGESSGEEEADGGGAAPGGVAVAAAGAAAALGGGGAREDEAPFRQRGRAEAMKGLRQAAGREVRRQREAARARLQAQEFELEALRREIEQERRALRQVCTGCLRLRARERQVHAKTIEDLGGMALAGGRKCASCFAKEAGRSATERHFSEVGSGQHEEANASMGDEKEDPLEALKAELHVVSKQVALGSTPKFRAWMLDKARELRTNIKKLEQQRKISLMQERIALRKASRPPSADPSRLRSLGSLGSRGGNRLALEEHVEDVDFAVQGLAAAQACPNKSLRRKARLGKPPR